MGDSASRQLDVSSDLATLCSSDSASEDKEVAFYRLRNHFCRSISTQESLSACAVIEAQRFPIWPAPPIGATRLTPTRLADRVRGLVFGCALGDSTGLATEFLSAREATNYYGTGFAYQPNPAKMYPDTHRIMWRAGDWTDDTDQLILILQSLLKNLGNVASEPPVLTDNDKTQLSMDFARRLKGWTEQGFPELGDESGAGLGRNTKLVVTRSEFLSDPLKAAKEVWERSCRNSAANGAVMRTAITGVPFFWDQEAYLDITRTFCTATHADPRCVASCSFVATSIALLLQGKDHTGDESAHGLEVILNDALLASTRELERQTADFDMDSTPAIDELQAIVDMARTESLDKLSLDEPRGIGYTYKCLAAGVWALSSENGFETTVQQLVAAGGDADTNAAVAGALLGCRLGFSQLPQEWIAQMPHASWLEAHVQKLLFMLNLRA